MKIHDMFYKKIDRDIKGVIKVGQSDNENIYQELDEYVVTSELEKYMEKFFDAYSKGLDGRTDKMGVWISGFFGSGKSHFLKILSYLLSDNLVKDRSGNERTASSFFIDDVKIRKQSLKKKIERVVSFSKDTDVILFNIDSKSSADSKMNKNAIVEVFMKVFNEYLGYCGSIPFLAELEHKMYMDGKFNALKAKFKELNGSDWTEIREEYYFIQDDIIKTLVSLNIMSESEAKNWAENAQNTYNLSINKFADIVRRYCESKGKNHHLLFLVDEIGQYIADDGKLMLNLQTVTEDLGTACGGRAWIIVTSQQDIDSITKTIGDDFSKIQGRFDTRIALSSANVDEVIRKRILYKNDEAAAILEDLYDKYESVIKNLITFSDGTPYMPLYKGREDFAEVYPFVPYQFNLLGSVLTAIRQHGASGKHLAEGERSMLALFKEAAVKVEDKREGVIVPFNEFYSALENFIDHTHRIVIIQAAKNYRLNKFDVELLKVLFMIKYVENFPKNVENLTTLMISDVNDDRIELRKKVEASLRILCDEMLVQKNGQIYSFLTNEEQEAENAIRHINIEPSDIVNYVAQVAFDEIIVFPNNKYSYNKRYQFSFNQKIDDRFYKNKQTQAISLHLMTAYSGEKSDIVLAMLSAAENSVIIRLSDDYPYLEEITEMLKITKFLNKQDVGSMTNYEVIRITKQKERKDKVERIRDYVRMAIETAAIYVNGEQVQIKTKDVAGRVNEALGKLIASEYSKLSDMQTEPGQSDILDMLKNNKIQRKFDLGESLEPNHDALNELVSAIRYSGKTSVKFSIKQAMDKFMAAPYGYIEEDVQYLIATLYKKGTISLKMNGVVYSPASTSPDDAYKYITRKEYREKILLEMKETPKIQWIKSVKDIIKDFFEKPIVTDDPDALMRDFRNYAEMKKAAIEKCLNEDYRFNQKLPGKEVLEKAVRLIGDTYAIKDPMTFYKRAYELFDDFDEVSLEIEDINSFLRGTQKDIFNRAYKILLIYEASKNFISDQKIIGYADQIIKIISLKKPYNYINKLDGITKQLNDSIIDLLEKDTERIRPDVKADHELVMTSLMMDRPYADRLKKKFENKFSELIDKMEHTHDVAALNGIPTESSALCQNCLNEIQKEEEFYQKSLVSSETVKDGDGEKYTPRPVNPVKTVKTIPLGIRTLTRNKTYTIKTEADVDAFVEEISKELKSKLSEGTIIKLN
ncbi:BREX system P-loop protein BrxC [Clostridium kluyveri]|uniref:BREX system P-loop protein BrxC n=1 Tax=Clostridium kluyveri TaxID=1534 RepID=UPI002245951D|nr:BREX system P-loop protein BrxC [Clostridium kluyveri]UZQ51666.1 BREX system P-loop protein BrxC [Clostridium kluyveri]